MERILVIGASGQIGAEMASGLRQKFGLENVICSDIRPAGSWSEEGPFELLDVMDRTALNSVVEKYNVTQVYLLAALLSAVAEEKPELAWKLNMEGLFNVLELARENKIQKIFWPSSIAVFGPTTPREQTAQRTITEPNTVYGIGKLAGERWCEYYHQKYGADVRGLRYPGIVGSKTMPGGGTTDYAVHIFHQAVKTRAYTCFLNEDTRLPMMYMPDAVRATLELMDAPADRISIRSSYNITSMSFTPGEIAREIKKHIPDFEVIYEPDRRQKIADSWP
ncbi:MAG: NAD-dependent epimerase/dehydratase family protein, partial [Flavobacteriales bacterium]|nr:NAD-dependent epimerase/dehydratase family protein [Flavobacteriales bacterium]